MNEVQEKKPIMGKEQITVIAILILIVIAGGLYFTSKAYKKAIPENPMLKDAMESGLKIEITQEGTGQGAKSGQTINVHYTGTLEDGTKFDSSLDRGTPFSFTLGSGQVIEGWDKGLLDMKVGEKRKLTIPSDMGYGPQGTPGGPIPPNATLIFDVEMIEIK